MRGACTRQLLLASKSERIRWLYSWMLVLLVVLDRDGRNPIRASDGTVPGSTGARIPGTTPWHSVWSWLRENRHGADSAFAAFTPLTAAGSLCRTNPRSITPRQPPGRSGFSFSPPTLADTTRFSVSSSRIIYRPRSLQTLPQLSLALSRSLFLATRLFSPRVATHLANPSLASAPLFLNPTLDLSNHPRWLSSFSFVGFLFSFTSAMHSCPLLFYTVLHLAFLPSRLIPTCFLLRRSSWGCRQKPIAWSFVESIGQLPWHITLVISQWRENVCMYRVRRCIWDTTRVFLSIPWCDMLGGRGVKRGYEVLSDFHRPFATQKLRGCSDCRCFSIHCVDFCLVERGLYWKIFSGLGEKWKVRWG